MLFHETKGNKLLSWWRTRRLTRLHQAARGALTAPGGEGPVVSLTSFGDRVERVWLTIESIGQGQLKPSRLQLWLDEAIAHQPLPASLQQQMRRGLEIQFIEDVGPHKKYYHHVRTTERFERPLVTADDDVLYPEHWLASLHGAHQAEPGAVHCFRAHRITLDGQGIRPYKQWDKCLTRQASHLNFATGVSGVIYPPAMLAILQGLGSQFKQHAPRADDIWLHWTALRNGFKVRQIGRQPTHFVEMIRPSASNLHRQNIREGGNDAQVASTYTAEDVQALRQALATDGP